MTATTIVMVGHKLSSHDVESSAEDPKSELRHDDDEEEAAPHESEIIEHYAAPQSVKDILRTMTTAGVELRGLEPVPWQDRTHTKYYNIMTLFGGSFISLLP
jgi:hypothetical protein